MIVIDWKEKAKDLKFNDGLSWSELSSAMQEYFPDLDTHQVYEKVRRYLRDVPEYNKMPIHKSKTIFQYESDKKISLYIIGDVHCGAWGFMEKEYKAYVKEIQDDDNAVVVIVGDLIDNATQGSKGCVFSQRMSPQKQKEKSIEYLYPIRDKIIFVTAGNHEERTFRQTGSDIMYDICSGLNVLDKYNYVQGYVKIKSGKQNYNIYATHNIGKVEATIRKQCKSFADIDLFVSGHIHTPKVQTIAQKTFGGKERYIKSVVCAAWLRDESYSISAAYEPCSFEQPRINLCADNKKVLVSI